MARALLSTIAAGVVISMVAVAQADDGLDKYKNLNGSLVSFTLGGEYSHATLTVSGPNGYHAQAFSRTGSPAIDLIKTGGTADGVYTYQITAASSDTVKVAKPMDNGRGKVDPDVERVSVSASGTFEANGGLINQFGSTKAEAK